MQRKRGTNHTYCYFFIYNTKNRQGTDNCTGMYYEKYVLGEISFMELQPGQRKIRQAVEDKKAIELEIEKK